MPIYENERSLRHRDQVLAALHACWPLWRFHAEKQGPTPLDGWFGDGKGMIRGVEVKRREDRYGMTLKPICDEGYMIDVAKIVRGLREAAERGARLTLAVDLFDGLWVTTMDKTPDWPIDIGGRRDRNDPNDIGPCYFIPTSVFIRLGASVTR